MAEAIVKETPRPDIAEMIASRSLRGRDLYLSGRQRLRCLGEDLYSVPGSGSKHYRVRYGGPEGAEDCECVDHQVHPHLPCKHLVCVGLMFAVRRRPETPKVPVAGDPFAAAGDRLLRELEDRLHHELTSDGERQRVRD